MAGNCLSSKDWLKFNGMWYIVWNQKILFLFEIGEIWNLVLGIQKEQTRIIKHNATTIILSANQSKILTWKKKDHITFVAK